MINTKNKIMFGNLNYPIKQTPDNKKSDSSVVSLNTITLINPSSQLLRAYNCSKISFGKNNEPIEKRDIKFENMWGEFRPDGNIQYTDKGYLAKGIITNDTRFVNCYDLSVDGNDNLKVSNTKKTGDLYPLSGAHDRIELKDNNNLEIIRERLINKGFFEKLTISNSSAQTKTMRIKLAAQIKDMFDTTDDDDRNRPAREPVFNEDGSIIFNTIIDENIDLGVKVLITVDGKTVPILKDSQSKEKTDNINVKHDHDWNELNAEIAIPANSDKKVEVHILPVITKKEEGITNQPYINGKEVGEGVKIPENYDTAFEELQKIATAKKKATPEVSVSGTQGSVFDTAAQQIVNKAFENVETLRTIINGRSYIAAGLPRFANLFGRDSMIAAKSVIPIMPDIARDTIEILGNLQGQSEEERFKDPSRFKDLEAAKWFYRVNKEGPGRILGVKRDGLIRDGHFPLPYESSFWSPDPTPLWLMLISEYYKWTGDKKFVQQLQPRIDAALKAIDETIKDPKDPDNKFSYYIQEKDGEDNRCWMDNRALLGPYWNDNVPPKGSKLVLAELQGYIYSAREGIANIYKEIGKLEEANELDNKNRELKEKFNREFWYKDKNGTEFIPRALVKLPDRQDYITCPYNATNSNGVQAMATGIVDDNKVETARKVAMGPDLYAKGVGIRTLGRSDFHDPNSYHNGGVWPHDELMGAMEIYNKNTPDSKRGLSHEDCATILTDMYSSIATIPTKEAPEVLKGHDRNPGERVGVYKDTCSPQGWACTAMIGMLFAPLGIRPNVEKNELTLNNPVLPEGLNDLDIKGLHVKDQNLALHFSKLKASENTTTSNSLTFNLSELGAEACQGIIKNSKGEFIKIQISKEAGSDNSAKTVGLNENPPSGSVISSKIVSTDSAAANQKVGHNPRCTQKVDIKKFMPF